MSLPVLREPSMQIITTDYPDNLYVYKVTPYCVGDPGNQQNHRSLQGTRHCYGQVDHSLLLSSLLDEYLFNTGGTHKIVICCYAG